MVLNLQAPGGKKEHEEEQHCGNTGSSLPLSTLPYFPHFLKKRHFFSLPVCLFLLQGVIVLSVAEGERQAQG